MAMEQTLAAVSQALLFPSASVPQNSLFSSSFNPKIQKLRPLTLRYSLQEQGYNQTVYPKPIEIPWKKELSNTVQLIGNVGVPVEIKQLPSGKVVAWTRLAVWKSSTETSWVNLTFWDEMAHVAYEHVQKGHRIAVSGRLITDTVTVENEDSTKMTYYKVVVQQLNFVESGLSPTSAYDHDYNNMTAGKYPGNGATIEKRSTEELWQDLFANPTEWWDNRNDKRTPNYPDFKHKDTGEALWIDGKYNPAPDWVVAQLAVLDRKTED